MKTTLIGNIGKDAILRTVQNGDRQDHVLSVWVAENRTRRDGTKKTEWAKVTIWRKYAGRDTMKTGTYAPLNNTDK